MKKLILGLISTIVIVLPAYAYDFVVPTQDSQSKQKGNTAAQLNVKEEIQSHQVVVKPNLVISVNPQKMIHLQGLEGRYALNCSKNKAHDLSYVISNTQITRLISAKKKSAAIKSIQADPVTEASYEYITTAKYQGFRVDFYQKDGKHFAKVKSRSISNFYGPKTKKLLQQCSTTKS